MRRGIVYINDKYAEFGYFFESSDNIRIIFEGNVTYGISYNELQDYLGFDYLNGYYVIGKDINKGVFPAGRDSFPYNLEKYTYNTKFVEELFDGKQIIENHYDFKYINELPFTFGLEFETAGGYIPQHKLYELGLIPLRDGSISGIEFSTVVLEGNLGLNLLKKQVEILDKHTIFDRDCSLHVHFGKFPLNGDILLKVNNNFCISDISRYLPEYTFDTTRYKTNTDKNYCAWNDRFSSFKYMYQSLVGRQFYGDLHQPHPKDPNGTRKWNIKSRYHAINFINAMCYEGPKTIEFRMLRPSYNFDKILGWLFIWGAFIKYAMRNDTKLIPRNTIRVEQIVRTVYSPELADHLCSFLQMSLRTIQTQNMVRDYYGMRVDIDDKIINYQTFGKYFY